MTTNWDDIGIHALHLLACYLLALPLGWEREQSERTAGLRTFPLVAIAACSFVLVAQQILETKDAQARVIEGLITGVGFIGGGAILKLNGSTSGTATAASLWATGAIGAAVGYGLYDIAVVISIIIFATLKISQPLKREGKPARQDAGDDE